MPLITAYEGQAVKFPKGYGNNKIVTGIVKLSKKYPFPVFNFKRGKLYAANVVGTVSQGSLRIEILPKINSESDNLQDRSFLLNLLKAAGYITRYHSATGFTHSDRGDFLELLISEAAKELVAGPALSR